MEEQLQQESRCVAMERLRREGRWNEACLYRESERRRQREAGKKKREANDLAWESMIATFVPMYVTVLEKGKCPPECVFGAEDEQHLIAVWWAFHTFLSRSWAREVSPKCKSLLDSIIAGACIEAPNELARLMIQEARRDSFAFCNTAHAAFTRMIQLASGDGQSECELRDRLRNLLEVDGLRVAREVQAR